MSLEFYIMLFAALALTLPGVIWTHRFWEAPTWVGFIFLAYIVPQAIYIERQDYFDTLEAWVVWNYVSLCLLLFLFGFRYATRARQKIAVQNIDVGSNHELLLRTVIILGLGFISILRVRELAAALELSSQWTGVITLYYLLFQCVFLSLAVAFMKWVKDFELIWLLLTLIALTLVLIAIGSNAKRSLTAEAVFILGGIMYFVRGWLPSRRTIIGLLVFGTILLHQVGSVRDYVATGQGNAFQAVAAGVPFEQFSYLQPTKAPELSQAVSDVYRTRQAQDFYGLAFHWNRMVHQYVPAFIVGRDTKEGIKFDIEREYVEGVGQFEWKGATRTGFSDTFSGFWYFGSLMFALLGWIMGRIYIHAVHGVAWAIFLYPLLLNDAMFAVTESTARFFSGAFFVAVVTLFLFYRRRRKRRVFQVRYAHSSQS